MTTEYLVWVDDDFHFSNQTDLRWMLSVMENTDLEVIGGKAGTSRFDFPLLTSSLNWRFKYMQIEYYVEIQFFLSKPDK